MDGPVEIDLLMVLIFLVAGGFTGGVIDLLIRLDFSGGKFLLSGSKVRGAFWYLVLLEGLIGIGGALAALFIFILTGWLSLESNTENVLLLIALSTVAGFGARKLLPKVYSQLERQVAEARRESKEAKEQAVGSGRMSNAFASLQPSGLPSEQHESIKNLEELVKDEPDHKTAVIVLGRLYRRIGDLKKAIKTLDRFIKQKLKAEELDDGYGDAVYNRACYKALMAAQDSGKTDLWNEVTEDLRESIRVSPENEADALGDQDFKEFFSRPEGIKLREGFTAGNAETS